MHLSGSFLKKQENALLRKIHCCQFLWCIEGIFTINNTQNIIMRLSMQERYIGFFSCIECIWLTYITNFVWFDFNIKDLLSIEAVLLMPLWYNSISKLLKIGHEISLLQWKNKILSKDYLSCYMNNLTN